MIGASPNFAGGLTMGYLSDPNTGSSCGGGCSGGSGSCPAPPPDQPPPFPPPPDPNDPNPSPNPNPGSPDDPTAPGDPGGPGSPGGPMLPPVGTLPFPGGIGIGNGGAGQDPIALPNQFTGLYSQGVLVSINHGVKIAGVDIYGLAMGSTQSCVCGYTYFYLFGGGVMTYYTDGGPCTLCPPSFGNATANGAFASGVVPDPVEISTPA